MSAGTLALILNFAFVFIMIIGFLIGLWRGVKKASLNLGITLAGVLVGFFVSGPIAKAVLGIKVSGGQTLNETIVSLILQNAEGVRYTSKENGNTVFFPFTETRIGDNTTKKKECNYWLGELNKEDSALAGTFYIYWANDRLSDYPTAGKPRYYGLPVRGIWLEEL